MSAVEGCWFDTKSDALSWLEARGYAFHETTMFGAKLGAPDKGFCSLTTRKIDDKDMWRAEISE